MLRTTVSFNEAAMTNDATSSTTAHLLSKDMIELDTLIGSGAYGQVRMVVVRFDAFHLNMRTRHLVFKLGLGCSLSW
jgi:hypothetical protein